MMERTPSPGWKATFTTVYLLVVLYTLVILGQVLMGVVVPLLLFVPSYFIWKWVDASRAERRRSAEVDDGSEQRKSPVETLKRRYAEGELSDAEFERKLERLVDRTEQIDGPGEGERESPLRE